ncbi:acyltransferase family protein [Ideonella sp. BN130291]|uniref:acyltransferase family protein n=1 Tax=Ideonella sp. BN130291 TaxID=3112940 RepID=UPI002E254212|nr:acyltransferase [Ideonella sp. BN130291]
MPHSRADGLAGLDTLRAAAIVMVFAYHYMVFVSREPTFGWLSTVGWAGVDLFFVLSGYLIGNQLFSGVARGREPSLKAFYARRFLRTLPNFYVVLALYFLFPAVMGGRTPPPLWRFLTFTQNIGLQPGTAFSHAWSLCIEEQFYLLLPALLVLGLRWRLSVRWGWGLVVGGILGGIVLRSLLWRDNGLEADRGVIGYMPNIYYASWARMDEFLPGVAIALLKNFHPPAWSALMARGRVLLVAALAALLLLGWGILQGYYIDGYGYGYFMTGFGYSLLACAFALLVLAALSPQTVLYRWRVPGAASLAAWSYAIYLTHKPLAFIVQRQLQGTALAGAALPAVVTLVCLAGGWLLYRAVETPFMRLRQRHVPSNFVLERGLLPAR